MSFDLAPAVRKRWLKAAVNADKTALRQADWTPEQREAFNARNAETRANREKRLRVVQLVQKAPWFQGGSLVCKLRTHLGNKGKNRRTTNQLHEVAADLCPSVEGCGRRLVSDFAQVVLNEQGAVRVRGVAVCGSVWKCPKCSSYIAALRTEELKQAVQHHKAAGGHLVMLTSTIAHSAGDHLSHLLDRLTIARDYFRTSRQGRDLVKWLKTIGYIGDVRNLEITAGLPSGWHPHQHTLQFFKRKMKAKDKVKYQEKAYDLWSAACLHAGLPQPSKAHGIDVMAGKSCDEVLAEYIAKYGKNPSKGAWGVEQEMGLAVRKRGGGVRLHPFGLLEIIADSKEMEVDDEVVKWATDKWNEYADAMPGQRQLTYSRRVINYIKAISKGAWRVISDEEIQESLEKQEKDEEIESIKAKEWNDLNEMDAINPMLAGVEAYIQPVIAIDRNAAIGMARQWIRDYIEERLTPLGRYKSCRSTPFLKCHRKVVVGGTSPPDDPGNGY